MAWFKCMRSNSMNQKAWSRCNICLLTNNTHIKMFQMGNSVFCRSNAGGSGSGSLTARHSPTRRTCVWDNFILNPDNVNCKHCYDVLKIKKWAPWNHLKRHIQRSPWQDMKQHIKYNDPVRNYGALSSFYQMIVITSIHFTILPLAFYLD